MKTNRTTSKWATALALAMLAGCGQKPEKITIPDSPDGAMQAVVKALSEDKPQALWSAMPASYQKQLKEVTSEFAAKMDKEIWDKSFTILGKLAKVAKEKQDFIFGSQAFADGLMAAKKDEAKKNWTAAIDTLDTLINSEIKTLDGVKNLDIENFLGTTGAKLMQNGRKLAALSPDPATAKQLDVFKEAKITLVKSEGDAATLKLELPGEPAKEEKFVKVEGRWVPEDMAKDFDEGIKKAKAAIAEMKFDPAQKTQIMTMLGGVDGALDQLLAAKTQDEFNKAVEGVMGMAMGAMMGGGRGRPAPGEDLDFKIPSDIKKE